MKKSILTSVDQTPDFRNRDYAEVMKEQRYQEEKQRVERALSDKAKAGELHAIEPEKKKSRFDSSAKQEEQTITLGAGAATPSHQQPGAGPRKRLQISSIRFVECD